MSLSAPVRDRAGNLVACIGLSGPSSRLGAARRRQLVPFVLEAATEVERRSARPEDADSGRVAAAVHRRCIRERCEAGSRILREPASAISNVDLVLRGGAAAELALAGTLQRGDVDLLHLEHCLHGPSRLRRIGVGE